jgi:arylsulfatase A-like enzyme
MNLRTLAVFAFLAAATVLMSASASQAQASKRPNIVYILADDLGYADVACYGSKYYETPHIDKLAADGARFTDAYNCGPNCQPTRAALMSGQYSPRTGIYTVGNINRFNWQSRSLKPVANVTSLPLEVTTVAESLKQAGYVTGLFGKWHLGKGAAEHPSQQGFDEAIVSAGKHFNFKTQPPVEYDADAYLADFLTDRAIDFVKRHKDEPFFLYLPHYGVHGPHEAKADLIKRFEGKPAAGGQHDPTYAAMIASVDESVGRVVAQLDELGLSENTLVIFSSDNGGVGGYRGIGLSKEGITDNAPLKGGKGSLYEGGIRVPYIFRWKGTIAAGRTDATPIHAVDFYPSLLELAGAPDPTGQPLDGVSYAALLKDRNATLDRDALFWHFPGYLGAGPGEWRTRPVSVVRSGDWKLIENLEDGKLQLYNLADDIGEQQDLAASEPERAEQLHARLANWRTEIGAKSPTPRTEADGEAPPKRGRKNRGKRNRAAASVPTS